MSAFIPPDWRNASAYPIKADEWPPGQWAWAFLRRNPEYQEDYEYFSSLPSTYTCGGYTSKWSGRTVSSDDEAILRHCLQPVEPNETISEYYDRTDDSTPYEYSIEAHLMEKWGIMHLADPADDEGCYCLPYAGDLLKVIEEKSELNPVDPIPENIFEITLRFDLRYSIDKQLNEAKEILHERKSSWLHLEGELIQHSSGIKIGKLPLYLRVYDARQAEVVFSEIGKGIHKYLDVENTKKIAFDAFKKAQYLVTGGYRELMK